ncbi:MFS transporter [Gulosibacter molinativorax]|uniref:MFS transporter n=1 Tax=Gulosibacter molinativorax TaxID=256821 RepID=A0ABT7C5P2_9MICO|nr:MFS transporter [Gulosibacter molinativorax]MDJ1370510.1 MFS transporter [Gulosibacter molinativorax]QUY62079.1 Putative paraquat/multidrug resistance efflux pump [Gulosibacter molinativorax]
MFELNPPSPRAGAREWAALGVLVLAVTLLAVDGTVLSLAVPALSAALDPTANQLLWIGDIYSFALAGLLITMGNLADKIGRKKLLLIGAVGFGLASALASFAPNAETLIAARAVLGISGATLMPSTLSIVRHMFAVPKERTRAIAIWSAGAAGGAALGPLVGGFLLEHFWWGSVFLINIPVMLVLVIAGLFLLPESKNPNPQKVDWLSSILSIAGIVPLVFAIKRVFSAQFDWVLFTSIVIGLVASWLFVRHQQRLPVPMLDLELFKVPAFRGAVISIGFAIFALSGLLFFFSQYLQLVRGLEPLQAGLTELPATIAMMVVVVLVSFVVSKLGVGGATGFGLILTGIGLAILAYAEGLEGFTGIIIALLITGFGIGLAETVAMDTVVGSVPRARAGAASAISETAYELGVALGIAVLGSLLTAQYRMRLPDLSGLSSAEQQSAHESLASGIEALSDSHPDVIHLLQESFTGAMQVTALVAAGLLILTGIFAWRTIPRRISVSEDTGQIEVVK